MRKQILIALCLLPSLAVRFAWAEPLDKVVAVVNNNVITASELQNQTELMQKQLQAKHAQLPDEAALRKQVLDHLIDVDLQLQMAKSSEIAVDDKELDSIIDTIAKNNKISVAQLKEELGKQGFSWKSYRDNLRKEVLISRLQQKAVGQELVISPEQVEDYMKTSLRTMDANQRYHLQNIVVPLAENPSPEQEAKAKVKAEQLLAKIKQGANFADLAVLESTAEYPLEGADLGERNAAELPEIFAKRVISMDVGEVAGPIRAGNGFQLIKLVAIQGDNSQHRISKTHVRHILVKQDANHTEADAIKQINNIYQQLKAGKNFAEMAKQYSLDPISAAKGGDLGWVTEEELTPLFAKAMANLAPKTLSAPVQSPFGWHLIEVLERKTIDDSDAYKRQQVRLFLQQKKFSENVQNWLQHMRAEAYVKIMDKELA